MDMNFEYVAADESDDLEEVVKELPEEIDPEAVVEEDDDDDDDDAFDEDDDESEEDADDKDEDE
jgi:hypothetical protein